MQPHSSFPSPLPAPFSKNVRLITGATGFLGKRLLSALRPTQENPVICLVRAKDAADARQRGASITSNQHVLWLRGDIQERQLGLNSATWHSLAGAVQEIFHSAASVDFNLPLAEAHAINVDGTARLLGLAETALYQGGFRRLHHVSTAYASGRTSGDVTADCLPADEARNFRNTYERTKARAERLLRTQRQVPVSIYRPSIIAGNTTDGRTDNWNVLYAPMRQIHRNQLPVMPKGGAGYVDCVGVDYVANGIAHLASLPAPVCAAFHLTAGNTCFNVNEFANACVETCKSADANYVGECKVVLPLEWRRLKLSVAAAARLPKTIKGRAARSRRAAKLAQRALKGFSPYEPYTQVNTRFDNLKECKLLAAANIEMPPWSLYLQRIIRYALAVDFGNRIIESAGQPKMTNQAIGHTPKPKLDLVVG